MRKLALGALFAFALALRLAGISHDLAEGYVYHPDSPKQVAATQQFLRGNYYFHFGNPDVDGYPYLNSHLVEILYRGYLASAGPLLAWMGVSDPPVEVPDRVPLHWVTRGLNVTLSAMTAVVVARLALESFGPGVALVAGLLVAVSPLDVVACHEANSDTTAAFFAALVLFFACRIPARGRFRDYALATLCSTASFAAKYHGAASFFAIIVAHVAWAGGWRRLFGADSLRRIAWVGVCGIVGLGLTIPPLLTHPVEITTDIFRFLEWVARESRVPEAARGGTFNRFTFSIARNVPIVASAVSVPLALVVLAGLARLRRGGAPLAVLYAMPLVYFFVGVAFRPLAPPVNHVLVSGTLLLIASAVLGPWLFGREPRRRAAAALLVLVNVAWLGVTTARELFFEMHPDTRLLARRWTRENVPASFDARNPGYGFRWSAETKTGPKGSVYVASELRAATLPSGLVPLKRFSLERESLQGFRNSDLDVYLDTPLLAADFVRPILPRIPSGSGNEVIFDEPDPFYRSTKLVALEPGKETRRIVVARAPLREALLVAYGGAMATRLEVSFAGTEAELDLGPEEIRIVPVDSPRRSFPFGRAPAFHRFAARSESGRAWVEIATSAVERGEALFRAGRFTEAADLLDEAARESRDPSVAALVLAASEAGGGAIAEPDRERLRASLPGIRGAADARRLDERLGGTLGYLATLEFLDSEAEDVPARGFAVVDDRDASGGRALATTKKPRPRDAPPRAMFGLPKLDAGAYRIHARVRNDGAEARTAALRLVDRLGHARATFSFELEHTAGWLEREADVELPELMTEGTLTFEVERGAAIGLDRLGIEPDVAATVAGRVRFARKGSRSGKRLAGSTYPVLVASGRRAAAAGDPATAAPWFRAAYALRPTLAEAIEGLAALDSKSLEDGDRAPLAELSAAREARRLRPSAAAFERGIELRGYRLESPGTRPGGELGLNLYFAAPRSRADLGRIVVWIHFVDESGRVMFQGGRALADYLLLARDPPELRPSFFRVPVPADVPPGDYRVVVGLEIPREKRILAPDSPSPGHRHGIELSDRVSISGAVSGGRDG